MEGIETPLAMKSEDWQKIAKWIGLAYLPVAILVAAVFLIIQWQMRKIDAAHPASGSPVAASSTEN